MMDSSQRAVAGRLHPILAPIQLPLHLGRRSESLAPAPTWGSQMKLSASDQPLPTCWQHWGAVRQMGNRCVSHTS